MVAADGVSEALRALEQALDDNIDRAQLMKRRIAEIHRQRASGLAWRAIVEAGEPPLVVPLLTDSSQALHEHGAQLRRAEALALHEEGMTMDQIAAKFG